MKKMNIIFYFLACLTSLQAQNQPFQPEKAWCSPLKKDLEAPSLFDLEKEVALNRELAADLQAHNYSYGILDEYLRFYHADAYAAYTWYETAAFFGYLGMRKTAEEEREMLYINWQNYSDGLEWIFGETCYLRAKQGADPYSVIRNEAARQKLKKRLKEQLPADVFLESSRSFVTEQRTSELDFPAKKVHYAIGILPTAGGNVLYFTENGVPIKNR